MGERALDEDLATDVVVVEEPVLPAFVKTKPLANSGWGEGLDQTGGDAERLIGGKHSRLFFESQWMTDIISVHARDEGCPALIETVVQGVDESFVRSVQGPQPRFPLRPGVENGGRAVR